MNTYRMRDDSGASETIEAESLEDAMARTREWAAGGDYDERGMVRIYVHELDPGTEEPYEGWCYGDERNGLDEVAVGPGPRPPATDCGAADEDHDWQSPGWLGGCRENPGVWSTGGTSFRFRTVCARCGLYKTEETTGAQRNPNELDATVEYSEPDKRSLAWAEESEA